MSPEERDIYKMMTKALDALEQDYIFNGRKMTQRNLNRRLLEHFPKTYKPNSLINTLAGVKEFNAKGDTQRQKVTEPMVRDLIHAHIKYPKAGEKYDNIVSFLKEYKGGKHVDWASSEVASLQPLDIIKRQQKIINDLTANNLNLNELQSRIQEAVNGLEQDLRENELEASRLEGALEYMPKDDPKANEYKLKLSQIRKTNKLLELRIKTLKDG